MPPHPLCILYTHKIGLHVPQRQAKLLDRNAKPISGIGATFAPLHPPGLIMTGQLCPVSSFNPLTPTCQMALSLTLRSLVYKGLAV